MIFIKFMFCNIEGIPGFCAICWEHITVYHQVTYKNISMNSVVVLIEEHGKPSYHPGSSMLV